MVACNVGEVIPFLEKYEVGIGTEPDSEKFAEGILALAADNEGQQKMGTESLRVAQSDFDWDNVMASLIKKLWPYWIR
jgi:glycosyltransferase involved in cell wall biosynthesis